MRNITNNDGSDLNVVITNQYEVNLPLEQTKASFLSPIVLSIKGLSTIGTSGQIIKVNSGGTALEYATQNQENISVSLPLDRTGDVISLTGLTTLGTSNQIIKMNSTGTALEYATQNQENIGVSLPLDRTGDVISLTGLTTLGTSNQIIKMNSTGTALEYGDDAGSNWTLSNGNLYPLLTSTNIVVGSTINSSTLRKLFVNGTLDVNGNIYFNGDDDLYIDADTSKNLRNYAGYLVGSIGTQHLFYCKQSNGVHTQIASISTGSISSIGNSNINSGNVKLNTLTSSGQSFIIINDDGGGLGGSPYVSFKAQNDNSGSGTSPYYYNFLIGGTEKLKLTNSGITVGNWNASKITETYGGTNQNSYALGDMLYCSATNTLSKISIGSTNQLLTVVGGVPSWANTASPDLTTSQNFGTAVTTGIIKLGNSSGSGYSSNLELYFNSTLKFFNTSNVNVATFTVSSSWVNLDLKGGTISNATIGSNGIWNGGAIEYNYGGTGLLTLTPNKILQINSSGNGYNMVDLPVGNTYSGTGFVSVNASTNVIGITLTSNSQLANGALYITANSADTLTNKSMSYSQLTGTPTVITNNNQITNGAGYMTASSFNTLTNKSMSYSQLTGTPAIVSNNSQLYNGQGFITASSTDTLTNKTLTSPIISNINNSSTIYLNIGGVAKLTVASGSVTVPSVLFARYYRIDGTSGYFETYASQIMYFGTTYNGGSTYFYYNQSSAKIISAGTWSSWSDERLKTDIQTGDDINKEMADYFDKIDINKYGYIPAYAITKNMTADERAYGFIAQQVESVFPEGVSNSGTCIFPSEKYDGDIPKVELDDVKVISKDSINMLLWGKIKDLDKTVKKQETELNVYKDIVNKLMISKSFLDFKKSLV